MLSTLALRQSSCTCSSPRFGWPLSGPAGKAAPPCLLVTSSSLKNRLPTWLTTIKCWKESAAKENARGSAERERRVARKHVGVGIARGERAGEMERAVVREVLLHPREVRADPHAGDDAAGVLAARAQQRPAARHEGGLSPRRIEHAAELRIGPVAAGADDDRLAGPDEDRFRAVVDIAVLPEALQTRTGLRVESRRIARPDTNHPARELLLPDDLVHVAVEDELDALFPGAELQTALESAAPFVRAPGLATLGAVGHQPRREVARAHARDSGILCRDRSLLDVRRRRLP